MPDQAGRTAVVTGANSGIGFETARVLAEHGGTVIMACRDVARGEAAAARITGPGPVSVQHLDLGSLASVRTAASELHTRHQRLDLLINNAGLMVPPPGQTEDGFELQFGVNHLGHFALTGLLLDLLLAAPAARVVTVSSNAHRSGRITAAGLPPAGPGRRISGYGHSKLANLLFTYELQRRLAAAGARASALAAHPGAAVTGLTRSLPGWLHHTHLSIGSPVSQSAPMGALPTLRAATDPGARGGEYYGPDGWLGFKGYPHRVSSSARSHDEQAQRRLWQESERLTGVRYPGS